MEPSDSVTTHLDANMSLLKLDLPTQPSLLESILVAFRLRKMQFEEFAKLVEPCRFGHLGSALVSCFWIVPCGKRAESDSGVENRDHSRQGRSVRQTRTFRDLSER